MKKLTSKATSKPDPKKKAKVVITETAMPVFEEKPVTYCPPEPEPTKPIDPPKPAPIPDKKPIFNFIKIPLGAYKSDTALPTMLDGEPEAKIKLAMRNGYDIWQILPMPSGYMLIMIRNDVKR